MPASRPTDPPAGERGFVLVAAIWLLVLAGSIAAILTLRSLGSATEAADAAEQAAARLAAEAAIETVLADRLFHGPRSAWWSVPHAGTISIGSRQVDVLLSSESGRLDVNEVDPKLIDAAFSGLGLPALDRGRILLALESRRAARRRIGTLAELRQVSLDARLGDGSCLADQLTLDSGLAEPRPDQMPPALASALGKAPAAPAPAEPGAALRIEARGAAGRRLTAVARATGLAGAAMLINQWTWNGGDCGGGR